MKIEEKYKLEKYIKEDGSEVNVYFDMDRQTIWMNQYELSKLFEKSRVTITKRINIIVEIIGKRFSVCSKFAHTGADNKNYEVEFYSNELIDKLALKFRFKKYYEFKEWVSSVFEKSKRDLSKKYEIVEFNDENISLDVNVDYEHDTVWLTQKQIARLYAVSIDNISLHIKNIYSSKELDVTSTFEESSIVQFEVDRYVTRNIKYYNFDMVLAIGYRINSKRGILFRKWASSVLKKYSFNGYAINEKRCLDCQSV